MKQLDVARKFLGEKEKPKNGGFYNGDLQKIMSEAGHKVGEAWCAYFAEAVFCAAYPERAAELRKLFSAGAVKTYENFAKAKYVLSKVPVKGALVIWQNYKAGQPTWTGHAGIVTEVISTNKFKSIEGNTNSTGGREGDSVAEKTRTTDLKTDGLNVRGFVIIPE